jgi:glyoxylase-like metal-dependent hydrolase (beta-lactamase superfamily II)
VGHQTPDDYVSTRRIGDATVTVINEGSEYWAPDLSAPEDAWRAAMPHLDADGRIPTATHIAHVQMGDASILIDAGLEDPDSAWWQRWQEHAPDATRTPGAQAGLASIGVAPADITHVLITHWHYDHVVGLAVERDGEFVPRYPNARVFMGRADWEGNEERENPDSDVALRVGAIERHGLLVLIDGDHEIVPGVEMLHTPGESRGHSVVRVTSGGQRFYALGDLFHVACEVEHLDWNVPWADPDAMRASRERMLREIGGSDSTVIFTHENFPPWGTIAESGGAFRWVRE